MIELFSVAVLCALFLSGLYFYKKICRSLTLTDVEVLVAQRMEQRAHQLCVQAFNCQRASSDAERDKLQEQFQDELHLYIEDFQAEVAESLQLNKVKNVQSYGFINLTK